MSAADFVGSTILVTILDPPGQLRGVVADIVGQQVRLENGMSSYLAGSAC